MGNEIKQHLNITEEEYEAIRQMIESADSPVGIDAKKTHILILQKLVQIEKRLEALERRVDQQQKYH